MGIRNILLEILERVWSECSDFVYNIQNIDILFKQFN